MKKETTVLSVCLLVLFADILGFWQTINLWLSEQILLNKFSSVTILGSLSVFAIILLWINYALIRKIISRQFN